MWTRLTFTAASLLATALAGCSLIAPNGPSAELAPETTILGADTTPSTPVVTAAATPEPAAAPQQDFFREGVNRAQSAVSIGQSAQSPEDWQLAASRWQQAITYMQQVPSSDENHGTAQQKVQEYQQNLTLAQRRAQGEVPASGGGTTTADTAPNGRVARILITERRGGTPVVSVKLTAAGGSQSFPLLFDTGATGTLITPAMAQAIGVEYVGEVVATVADGRQVRLPIGFVDIEVGGLVKRNVPVAVGGNMGLLGQDVYGEYGISAGGGVIDLYE
ncbi:TIGR02281 family clan AA aspartic protease [Leptolyngbya sp. PCC 6406]|uniref:retropepsin-like aspartic protease family protein n=1 Tax=Leptolyngbya sp. PCC 6406 TaxID=1173264 RepID=UPI0002ABE2FA|nr:retropepsin-like aspartic protease [Leptolyngbya sp. PCC 6406]